MGRDRRVAVISHSPEETLAFGQRLGRGAPDGTIFCLYGDLGAGKTTLIKGIVAGATGLSPSEVTSPTFTRLHAYEGKRVVYHFDLYRLRDEEEFLLQGLDEPLYEGAICCIEWPERISGLIPPNCVTLRLSHVEPGTRRIITENAQFEIPENLSEGERPPAGPAPS